MCEKGKNSLFTLKAPRLIEQSRPSKLNPDEINLEREHGGLQNDGMSDHAGGCDSITVLLRRLF